MAAAAVRAATPPPFEARHPRPIFLHGLWRSGSTFVWSRFRAAADVTAFFEPLNPALGRLTHRRIRREGWREAMARNRHPVMEEPYFAEYEPLVRGRGVRRYSRSFAVGRFAQPPTEPNPALEAYIGVLRDHAWTQRRRPVLGFVRTGLRMGSLRAAFGAYDIHIDRDPLAIWASYQRHAQEGTYNFFTSLLLILERNATDPLFAPLAARHPLRRGLERTTKPRLFYRDAIDRLSPEDGYGLVFYFWLLTALHALSHADLIFDMSLAEQPSFAGGLEVRLRRDCGLEVSFDGVATVREAQLMPLFDRRAAEARVLTLLPVAALAPFIDETRVQARLDDLAPAKAEILSRVLASVGGSS